MADVDFYEGMSVSMRDIPGLAPEIPEKLAELGLLDAEQFADAASIPAAAEPLRNYLGLEPAQFTDLLINVQSALPATFGFREQSLPDLPMGAFPPPDAGFFAREMPPMQMAPPAAALPPSVNHAAVLGSTRSQGGRGTCVAFAVTAIHEFHSRINGQSVDYSEQFLYDETKKIDGSPAVCGTWQVKAAQVLGMLGQCLESVWPYNSALPCNANGHQPANAKADASQRKLQLRAIPPTNVLAIKGHLAQGAVVGFSIPVFSSWYDNATSRIHGRIGLPAAGEQPTGGHAMCLVGYQDQANVAGGGYFILRNSWRGFWGQKCPFGPGNGVIPYQYISQYNWEAVTF